MSEPDEIHHRVTRLEHQMIRVEQDAAAARLLAGGADHDVSEFRAVMRGQTGILNAIGETQREHSERLAEHSERLADHSERLAEQSEHLADHTERLDRLERKVDTGFAEMSDHVNRGFTTLNLGMAQLTALLTVANNEQDES